MQKVAIGLIEACSALVQQLDAHQTGGALFVCCLALVVFGVVVSFQTLRGSGRSNVD